MKFWSSMAASCLIALSPLMVSAQQVDAKTQEKFVGKWEASEGEIKGSVFEFAKTGDLKLTIKAGENKIDLTGKFKVVSEDSIEMTIKGPDGKEQTEKLKFKIEKDELSITGPDGKTIKFTKAK